MLSQLPDTILVITVIGPEFINENITTLDECDSKYCDLLMFFSQPALSSIKVLDILLKKSITAANYSSLVDLPQPTVQMTFEEAVPVEVVPEIDDTPGAIKSVGNFL